MRYEQSARFTPREKLALRYADAILYDPAQADDRLWADLHAEFSEPELVELGYWIGFTFGGQRWLKTLGTKQGELEAFLKARYTTGRQLAVSPTAFTTFSFWTIESCTTLRKSAGPRMTISVPCTASAFLTSGSSVVFITAARNLSAMAFGVPFGTKNPCHPL